MNLRKNTTGLLLLVFSTGLLFSPADPAAGQIISNAPGEVMEHVRSYQFLARGVRAQKAGQHGLAYDNFKAAAREANKTAQFMLGLMYLDGTYRDIDPLRAWAWMALASERGYPQYSEVTDKLWQDLGEEFQPAAWAIFEEELKPVFGDAVAIPRVAREMRRERNNIAGSRLGFVGALRVADPHSVTPGPNADMIADSSKRHGGEFYAPNKWDFEQIVEFETQFFLGMGTVAITDIETAEDQDATEK